MNTIELKAKAKVNLILNVLGKRPDGYHELQMVMQAIDLADDVRIEWERQTGEMAIRGCFLGGMAIALDPGHKKLPSGPNNLAYQAASKMYDAFHRGRREVCTIEIRKNIPLAAGLAGGSTDAAAVIWGLARLWDLAPNETDEGMDPEVRQKLFDIALSIGSDVPFCLAAAMGHTAAVAEGLIDELARPETPRLTVYNKADLILDASDLPEGKDVLLVSAATGRGLPELLSRIGALLEKERRLFELLLPYGEGGLLERLHREGRVLQTEYQPEGVRVAAEAPRALWERLAPYDLAPPEPQEE